MIMTNYTVLCDNPSCRAEVDKCEEHINYSNIRLRGHYIGEANGHVLCSSCLAMIVRDFISSKNAPTQAVGSSDDN